MAETLNANPVFSDAQAMKDAVRKELSHSQYNVHDLYGDNVFAKVARSAQYENVKLCVTSIMLVWLSIDADHNEAKSVKDASVIFIMVWLLILTFFCIDVAIRFLAFKKKIHAFKDSWFVFDFVLTLCFLAWLLLSVTTDGGTFERNLLLIQILRAGVLIRAVPELSVLLKGLVAAARSVSFVICLLTLITYLFGIFFTINTRDMKVGKLYFETVPAAMHTLLLDGMWFNFQEMARALNEEAPVLEVCFLVYFLLTFTCIVIMAGVMCEVVSVIASVEKEHMTVTYGMEQIKSVFESVGVDVSGSISKEQFQKMLITPEAARLIQSLGVDVIGLVDMSDFIFKDGSTLSIGDLFELVCQLRGTNNACVKDIVDLRKFMLTESMESRSSVAELIGQLQKKVDAIEKSVKNAPDGTNDGPDNMASPFE